MNRLQTITNEEQLKRNALILEASIYGTQAFNNGQTSVSATDRNFRGMMERNVPWIDKGRNFLIILEAFITAWHNANLSADWEENNKGEQNDNFRY